MTRQDEFKAELFALLRKYDVEMTVRESDSGWHSSPDGIDFCSNSVWEDGELVQGMIELRLGVWEDGKV